MKVKMNLAESLELHYFLANESHSIDASIRNKCEADLLTIFREVSAILEIDQQIESFAYQEGGLKERWKFIQENAALIGTFVAIAALILSRYPTTDIEKDAREKIISELTIEEKRLAIEEKRLNLEKLKKEIKDNNVKKETIESVVSTVDQSLKIQATKSSFYKKLSLYNKVSAISLASLDSQNNRTDVEHFIQRANFRRFILSTDSLPTEKIEDALIEIISPVLREGFYNWKGIFEDRVITFTITDADFKQGVHSEIISFQHGTVIECVLLINRKLRKVCTTQDFESHRLVAAQICRI
jgi:hypothetical protein